MLYWGKKDGCMNSKRFTVKLFSVVMAICLTLGVTNAAEFNVNKCHSVCQSEIRDGCLMDFNMSECYGYYATCINDCNNMIKYSSIKDSDVASSEVKPTPRPTPTPTIRPSDILTDEVAADGESPTSSPHASRTVVASTDTIEANPDNSNRATSWGWKKWAVMFIVGIVVAISWLCVSRLHGNPHNADHVKPVANQLAVQVNGGGGQLNNEVVITRYDPHTVTDNPFKTGE